MALRYTGFHVHDPGTGPISEKRPEKILRIRFETGQMTAKHHTARKPGRESYDSIQTVS
jgi:hypothetical protein